MRKLTFFGFFLALMLGMNVMGASYFVSSSGNDSSNGSLSSPFKTLEKAVIVVQPGDYIYLRGGTYNMTVSSLVIDRAKSGTSSAMIRVFAYGSETPVLRFDGVENSSNRGIVQDAAFWHWKGVTIERAGDNGMLLSGNNNIIEDCVFRRNCDTGLQLSRYSTSANSISQWPSNNLIVGCESYDNKDSGNENADGFAAKLTSGTGNIFRDCVAHHNIDDGWDLYTKSDTGPIGVVIFENCIAHNNGLLTDGTTSGGGDKNGFKLGSSAHNINHELRRCIAFNNGKHGFTDNGNVGSIKFYNLSSYNNGDYNFHTRDNASHLFRNCLSFDGNSNDRIRGDATPACNALTDFNNGRTFEHSASAADFTSMTPGPNSAPTSNGFLNLKSTSPLINAGCSVSGVSGNGALDLGALEFGGSTTPPPTTTYTLSTSASGSGSVSGAGTYEAGSSATVTALPVSGWSFSNWTGAASGSVNPVTITMNANKSVTAVFVETTGGGTTPPPASGDAVVHNFTESGTSSSFYDISGNLSTSKGTVIYNGLTLNQCLKIESGTSITFTSAQAGTLTLVFNDGFSGAFKVDGTSYSATNGVLTVDLSAGSHALSKADVANLYYMSLSNGGGTTTPPPPPPPVGATTITLQENQTGYCGVEGTVDSNNAGFTGAGFANTDNATGNGIDYAVNAEGGETTLLIQYANGASDRPAKIVVNGSTAVGALSLTSTGSWTSWTSASTVVTLQNGVNTIRLEATNSGGLPNIDYLSVSGTGVSAASCDPSDPSSYTLTTTVNGSGSVSPSQGTFNAGTSVVLTATPASGWEFTGWSGGYTGTSATVVMDANKNITANFSQVSMPGVDFSMKGYATVNAEGYSTTTGGAGGSTRTISSLSDLENWASSRENNTSPEVVYISGRIASSSSMIVTIKHGANISILGIGSTAELQNIGLNIRNYQNVIVRNLKIHEVLYPNDALTIDECTHVWVDHCELHSKIGSGIGVDTYDGLLDIKKGSRYVTISWCYLHDHMKCSLIGHTNNTSAQSTDSQMRITYHHNYFYNTDGRNPSLRYGAIHMYNNYFNKISDYGLAARVGAHALVENNHYNDVLLPLTTDKFPVSGLPNGYICQTGNLFTGSCGDNVISQTGCNWWNIPYNYTLDPASTLSSIVPANVGVGKIAELKSATVTTGNESIQVQKNQLYQNYPNPFTDETTIRFNLQNSGMVSLAVFDMTGRKVVELFNGYLEAGEQSISTAGSFSVLPSGAYVYQLKTSVEVISKMMMKQ